MANEYLQRTPTSTGNRRVYTLAFWLKRTTYSTFQSVFSGANTNNVNETFLYFIDGVLRLYQADGAGNALWSVSTPQSIRDSSSMCHAVISVDTTQALSSDRVKIYINGVLSVISSATYPTINYLTNINTTELHKISGRPSGIQFFEGYLSDFFFVDGQALTPDVFGFYKEGKGYISAGSTQATDFRPGQWVPKTPRVIKTEINRRGGFGVNGFYLPMNDSRNFGADFHCEPNSIIKLNEELPQPRVGVATTASVGLGYTDALRADPYAANLVLALPFVSSGLCTNGTNSGINTGFGDYSHIIRGSGSAKVATLNGGVGIANTAGYYGSAVQFIKSSSQNVTYSSSTDFAFGTGDFTLEYWINYTSAADGSTFETAATTGTPSDYNGFWVGRSGIGTFTVLLGNNSSWNISLSGPSVLPINQWHHIALCRKGSNVTAFINGSSVGIATTVTQSLDNVNNLVAIGGRSTPQYSNAYIQDLRIYKGVAKYTGGFDVPKPYTPVGIATWRAVPDSTANNFATWNPVSPASDTTFTNGNLTVAYGTNATRGVVTGTIGIAVTGGGKYYWENRIDASSSSPSNALIGVWGMSTSTSAAAYPGFTNTYGWSYYGNSGGTDGFYWATGGSTSSKSYGATYAAGDIIGVTLDMTTNNGSLEFYKNGVSQGVATTGIGTFLTDGKIHAIMPAIGDGASAATYTASSNFGQNPTFSGNVSIGTFTDSNGKGLFKYQPPSGFLALCEDNLPTPAIADPGEYFKTVLYTGDGSSGRSITGIGFTPDLVWIKRRNGASDHVLQDSVRGFGPATKLSSSATNAESVVDNGATDPKWGYLNSAGSDGFSLNASTSGDQVNKSTADPYVAWCWRAGAGTTSTNTDGSIQSVISVNQDAGFSIVSYTGNGVSGATIGHGLGKRPKMIISKKRDEATNWYVWFDALTQTTVNNGLSLNSTSAVSAFSFGHFTSLNSSTITLTQGGSGIINVNTSSSPYIAYCWAEIEGFSKFGSYVGNGNADGPFVYCGFKPAFVLCKTVNTLNSWVLGDSSRGSTNPSMGWLVAHASDAEYTTGGEIDYLSNGFKIRNSGGNRNTSGETYIFAAFAESPFTTANAK